MNRDEKKATIFEALAAQGITDETVAAHGISLDEIAEKFIDATESISEILKEQEGTP